MLKLVDLSNGVAKKSWKNCTEETLFSEINIVKTLDNSRLSSASLIDNRILA
jgi:hypothetical protein